MLYVKKLNYKYLYLIEKISHAKEKNTRIFYTINQLRIY